MERPSGKGTGKGRALKPPTKSALARMYWSHDLGGMNLTEIAARLDVCTSTVSKWMRAYGIPLRETGKPQKMTLSKAELRQMYSVEGMTLMEIAANLGCQWETVRRWVTRFGIPRRKACIRKCQICKEKGCKRPVKNVWHPKLKVWYGTRCAKHRQLHYAMLNRWEQRRKFKRSPETWVYQNEVPESFKRTKKYKEFLEEQCLTQARNQLAEARSFLRRLDLSKSQNAGSQPDKTL